MAKLKIATWQPPFLSITCILVPCFCLDELCGSVFNFTGLLDLQGINIRFTHCFKLESWIGFAKRIVA